MRTTLIVEREIKRLGRVYTTVDYALTINLEALPGAICPDLTQTHKNMKKRVTNVLNRFQRDPTGKITSFPGLVDLTFDLAVEKDNWDQAVGFMPHLHGMMKLLPGTDVNEVIKGLKKHFSDARAIHVEQMTNVQGWAWYMNKPFGYKERGDHQKEVRRAMNNVRYRSLRLRWGHLRYHRLMKTMMIKRIAHRVISSLSIGDAISRVSKPVWETVMMIGNNMVMGLRKGIEQNWSMLRDGYLSPMGYSTSQQDYERNMKKGNSFYSGYGTAVISENST